jgi:hypothetical protein
MLVYGHLINPGHEKEFYDNHIQIAAPYCSIIAGIPLMFLAGWLISSWWEGRFRTEAALAVWGVYALIDIAVALMAGVTMRTAGLVAISLLTKLGAVYLGAVVGGRRSEM